ncbi:MAG: hypothetical protein WCR69_03345 [Sulfuricurvum sp.]
MSNAILETLRKDLETAKETNSLTLNNIGQIVQESTTKIVKELRFNKEMSLNLLNDMLDTTITTLVEMGEDTKESIKVSTETMLNTIQEYAKKRYDEQNQAFEEVQKNITGKINNLKDKGDSLNSSIKDIVDSAIESTKELL